MTYPATVARVAALAPQRIDGARRLAPLTRDECRTIGAQFVAFVREEIGEAARSCAEIPEPKQLVKDVKRGRDASDETIASALVALALCPTMTDRKFARFTRRVSSWLDGLRPRSAPSLMNAWAQATQLQATGDVTQALAVTAIERGDRAALDTAIAATAAHIAAESHLLAAMQRARIEMTASPMMSRIVATSLSRLHQ